MKNISTTFKNKRSARRNTAISVAILPAIWLFLSYAIGVPQRYLPSPDMVLHDIILVGPQILLHSLISLVRIITGFLIGSIVGLLLGTSLYKYRLLASLFLPNIHAIRAVPAVATIPFFILWFGFSEYGKVLIFVLGISLNLAIAVYQILIQMPDKYRTAIVGFQKTNRSLSNKILLPLALDSLLPTLRFSLTVAIGLGVVAELLGAQSGLGYLIQSARATYSLGTVLICIVIYGLITALLDYTLKIVWVYLVPWRSGDDNGQD